MKSVNKCINCYKKTQSYNIIECKYCFNKYCIKCCGVEIHKCVNFNEYKEQKLQELEKHLLSGKENENNNLERI